MEVHHHSHEGHGKRNWKSYIREFLMLFLAVFCGFLAEYQLEHKIEKDRERVYIQSMIEDLQADTTNLRLSMESFKKQDNSFDTIFDLYDQLAHGYNHSLRSSIERIVGYRDFFPTDKTLQQLKSSGGMRLIRNKKSVDGITTYDSRLKEYEKSLNTLDDVFFKMYDQGNEILNTNELAKDRAKLSVENMQAGGKNYLLQSDNASLGKYYNQIKSYRLLRQIVYRRMEVLLEYSKGLIEVLKKEYDLE